MIRTVGAYWDAARGRPAGFDLLRVVLATAVVLWHSVPTAYGDSASDWFWSGPLRPVIFIIVPAFFALSGFLVAGSLERNDIASFLTLRAMRIFPALAGEVVISAIIIGPIFTVLPLAEYFSSGKFFSYFLNIVGNVHYYLPGVFLDLPVPRCVNVQLWPIPYELECYLVLAALSVIGLTRRPRLFLAFVMVGSLSYLYYITLRNGLPDTTDLPPGRLLVLCFLFGVAGYLLRNRVAHSFWLFLVSLGAFVTFIYFEQTIYLAPLPIAYITVYLGVLNFRLPYLARAANYSYGVYLYGYPVQQAVSAVFPHHREWYFSFLVGGVITLGIAMLSWHFLESKVAARRGPVLAAVGGAVGPFAHYAQTLRASLLRRATPLALEVKTALAFRQGVAGAPEDREAGGV